MFILCPYIYRYYIAFWQNTEDVMYCVRIISLEHKYNKNKNAKTIEINTDDDR